LRHRQVGQLPRVLPQGGEQVALQVDGRLHARAC